MLTYHLPSVILAAKFVIQSFHIFFSFDLTISHKVGLSLRLPATNVLVKRSSSSIAFCYAVRVLRTHD